LPDAQASPATGSGTSRKTASTQNSEDTTYENSSTHTVTVRVPGQIKRLSIAVMVDGGPKGLPAAQIQRLTRIVENAAGIDTKRGDSVVVESMPFTAGDALAENKSGLLSLLPMDKVFSLIELLVIAVVGIIVLRMLLPKPAPEPVAMAEQTPQLGSDPERLALAARAADGDPDAMQQIAALGGEQHLLDQEIALAQVDGRIKLSALKRIGTTIAESPPESASVIRQWMNS
jgi:flagellar M-ring protein FliF